MRCDLHLHSTCSDGALAPRELVRVLASRDVRVFALTDHDTLAGLTEARDEAKTVGATFVSGVEISTLLDGRSIHVLGYGIELDHGALAHALAEQRALREDRSRSIVRRLNALGVPLTEAEVRDIAGTAAPGRIHVARALLARGAVGSVEEAFARFLGDRAPACVPKASPEPGRAIRWIHDAGGVAVWAHPLAKPIERHLGFPALARELQRYGLDGIELIHPGHDASARRRVRRAATELGWLVTGGSDFHGGSVEAGSLGPEELTVEIWGPLLSRLEHRC